MIADPTIALIHEPVHSIAVTRLALHAYCSECVQWLIVPLFGMKYAITIETLFFITLKSCVGYLGDYILKQTPIYSTWQW